MATSRYAIAIADENQIYTKSFFWAVTDKTWRWRNYPPINEGLGETIEQQSIQVRDDMTIYMRGKKFVNGTLYDGYWYQRLLNNKNEFIGDPIPGEKVGLKPVEGYSHKWHFMSSEAFKIADKNYFESGNLQLIH